MEIDGKANQELIKLLAEKLKFDVPKSGITIQSGQYSRIKLIEIDSILEAIDRQNLPGDLK